MSDAPEPVVALLRGINVGGRSVLAMTALKSLLAEAGLVEARTYLQSGNVIVTPSSSQLIDLGPTIEKAIEGETGMSIRVMVRTRDDLARVVAGNPLLEPGIKPSTLHTVFLERAPDPSRVAELDPDRSPPDRFAVSGQEIHLYYPQGSGRSKLNLGYLERTLGVAGTARNWNTVTKLLAMLRE
ncbi:MAG: DUF1697 domain-containing protein [Acidimicrobiia bacterium]